MTIVTTVAMVIVVLDHEGKMAASTSEKANQLAILIHEFLLKRPDIKDLHGLSNQTGISYDSLRKYAKGINYPPAEKQKVLLAFINRSPEHSPTMGLFTQSKEHVKVQNNDIEDVKKTTKITVLPELGMSAEPDPTLIGSILNSNRRERSDSTRQELYLPVHGFVWYSMDEMEIIDHAAFQRLAGLHQLGLAHLVYRGATHRRLEHALGTVWTAQRIIDAIAHNSSNPNATHMSADRYKIGRALSALEQRFIRLAALLHDIGHVPFGHTFEDELGIIDKHDDRSRLLKVLNRTEWLGTTGKPLAQLINELYADDVPHGLNITPSELLMRIILHESIHEQDKSLKVSDNNSEEVFRISICADIVGNTICADFLDYLYRDWYHIGKPQYYDDRIFHYMEIRTPVTAPILQDGYPESTSDDAFVVSIGSRPKLRTDGVSTIMGLLDKRYELSEAVIFHRGKMIASAMLERALSLTLDNSDEKSSTNSTSENPTSTSNMLVDWLLNNPEEALLLDIIRGNSPLTSNPNSPNAKRGQLLAAKLVRRELHDHLLAYTYDDEIGVSAVERIQRLYSGSKSAADNRANALSLLEQDFGLEAGSVVMYCPGEQMNRKIAEVRLFLEGDVMKFDEYERDHNNILSAGRLNAQLERHKHLWQVGFYVDRTVTNRGEDFLLYLGEAIRHSVLGILPRGATAESMTRQLALKATALPNFHRYGHQPLSASPRIAARSDELVIQKKYPSGASTLLSYIADVKS